MEEAHRSILLTLPGVPRFRLLLLTIIAQLAFFNSSLISFIIFEVASITSSALDMLVMGAPTFLPRPALAGKLLHLAMA